MRSQIIRRALHSSFLALLALPFGVFAQEADASATPTPAPSAAAAAIITAEGISGSVDNKHRNPVISVSSKVSQGSTKILVDVYVPNGHYKEYPFRIDYFVNRSFLTSQIRSIELPGPLGVDVPDSLAKPPFNYTIIATLLHPNRQFTSTAYGVAYPSTLAVTFPTCTLSVQGEGEEPTDYSSSDVASSQAGNSALSLSMTTAAVEGESASATVSLNATVDGTSDGSKTTGSISYTIDGQSSTVALTGTAGFNSDQLASLSLKSSDGAVEFACE